MGSRGPIVFPLVPRVINAQNRDSHRSVGAQEYVLLKESSIPGRIAIRREAHDLVFVGVKIKAQVQSHQRVENPDRIGRRHRAEKSQIAISRFVYGNALRLAHTVDHDNKALRPPGCEVGAGGMREMMFDWLNAVGWETRIAFVDAT